MEVGEVTAAASGNCDLLADAISVLEDDHATSALTGFDGAKETGCTGADHYDVGAGDLRRRDFQFVVSHFSIAIAGEV